MGSTIGFVPDEKNPSDDARGVSHMLWLDQAGNVGADCVPDEMIGQSVREDFLYCDSRRPAAAGRLGPPAHRRRPSPA